MQEVDDLLIKRCHVAFDTVEALAVGDLKSLGSGNHGKLFSDLIAEDAVNRACYRLSDDFECTFFKSVGTAIQDILTAEFIANEASRRGIGINIDMK